MTKKQRLIMWAGFESGEIYREPFNSVHDGYGNIPSRPVVLFSNKQHASLRFEDIRRVEIREIKHKSRGAASEGGSNGNLS